MPPSHLLVITSLPPLITEKNQSTRIGRLSSSSTSSSVRILVFGLAKDVDKLGVAPGSDPPGLPLCAGPTIVCHHKSVRRQATCTRIHTRRTTVSSTDIVMASHPSAVEWVSSSSVSAPASSRRGRTHTQSYLANPLASNRPSRHKEDVQQDIARVYTHTHFPRAHPPVTPSTDYVGRMAHRHSTRLTVDCAVALAAVCPHCSLVVSHLLLFRLVYRSLSSPS